MNSKNIKISIIIVLAIIVVITMLLIVLKNDNKAKYSGKEIATEEIEEKNKNELKKILNRTEYNAVNGSVSDYIKTLNMKNTSYYVTDKDGKERSLVTDDEKKQNVLNLLSNNYINKNNITTENIEKYIKLKDKGLIFVITDIKKLSDDEICSYIVKGITENFDYQLEDEVCFIVYIDFLNKRYAIEPSKENFDEFNSAEKISEIENKKNNTYVVDSINTEKIVREYFNIYKRLVLASPEKVYEKLDKEYREKKFGTVEEFINYIKQRSKQIKSLKLEKYLVKNYDSYAEYIGVDSQGKEYIFREKSLVDYNILLDTYTVDLPEFLDKYNTANDTKKVGYNIEKFISALNDKDYKYAYNLLDEVYKQKNIPSIEDFEKYVKNNLYENMKVEHKGIEKQGNNFIYKIGITNAKDENSEEITMTIIMQLGSGTDFVMSFSID